VIVTALLLKPANQWTQWTSVSTRRMILALPWALRLLPLEIWYLRASTTPHELTYRQGITRLGRWYTTRPYTGRPGLPGRELRPVGITGEESRFYWLRQSTQDVTVTIVVDSKQTMADFLIIVRLGLYLSEDQSNETSRLIQSLTYLENRSVPCFATYGRFDNACSGLTPSRWNKKQNFNSTSM
jgi:hypothetical protein